MLLQLYSPLSFHTDTIVHPARQGKEETVEPAMNATIGHFRLVEKLGEGGMAIVYKAFDTRSNCPVALKMIRPTQFEDEQLLKRFEREARALATLSHPNIVKVLDHGQQEDAPYLVMEFISGGMTLRDRLGQPLGWQAAARLLLPIARAVEHAHQQGIIHRDIKPANILIDENGQPKLADFGIVKFKAHTGSVSLTGTHAMIGTPEYMAPEQGMGKNIDHRADIYALGIIFYEMVTGKRPYQANTPVGLMLKKIQLDPPKPGEFSPGLPEAVEQVILTAISRRPEDRFQTMGTFIAALEPLAKGKLPTPRLRASADPEPAGARRTARPVVAMGILLPLLLLAGLSGWLLSATGFFTRGSIRELAAGMRGLPTTTLAMPATHPPTPTASPVAAPSLTSTLASTFSPTPTFSPTSPATPTPTQTLTPLPSYALIGLENIGQIELMKSLECKGCGFGLLGSHLGHYIYSDPQFSHLVISPDESFVAITSLEGIQVWRTADWELVYSEPIGWEDLDDFDKPMPYVAFSSHADLVAISGQAGIWLADTQDWKNLRKLAGPDGSSPGPLVFSHSGEWLLAISDDLPEDPHSVQVGRSRVNVWETITGRPVISIQAEGHIESAQFSPDETYFATVGLEMNQYEQMEPAVQLWLAQDGSKLKTLDGGRYRSSTGVQFSEDGSFLASGTAEFLVLWQVTECPSQMGSCGKLVGELHINKARGASELFFSADGQSILYQDRVWWTGNGRVRMTVDSYFSANWILPDGQSIAYNTENGISFLDLNSLVIQTGVFDSNNQLTALCMECGFSKDGWLIATHQDELLRIRQADNARVVFEFKGVPSAGSVSFSPGGRFIVIVSRATENFLPDYLIHFWGINP
jgi:serine/threonine protein kinase/WD40 repeat protein